MLRSYILEIFSFLIVLLFVYAALNKLLDYEKFTIQVGQSPLLTGFGSIIPPIVIAAELITAALLAFRRFRLLAFTLAFGIMTTFTGYIIFILTVSPYIPCSCGGILDRMGWTEHLVFNMVYALLALIAIVLQVKEETKTQPA